MPLKEVATLILSQEVVVEKYNCRERQDGSGE